MVGVGVQEHTIKVLFVFFTYGDTSLCRRCTHKTTFNKDYLRSCFIFPSSCTAAIKIVATVYSILKGLYRIK